MKKTLVGTLIALVTFTSSALAASAAADNNGGILTVLFVGFFSLIIIFQLVPATLMLIGMVRGLLSGKEQLDH